MPVVLQYRRQPLCVLHLRTLVINLDEDLGRRSRIAGRLRSLRLPFGRLPAVPKGAFFDRGARAGYFACAASHLAAITEAAAVSDGENVLILEDDAVLRDDTLAQVPAMMRFLPPGGWDIFYLGSRVDRGHPAGPGIPLTVVEAGFHTHAYIVHGAALKSVAAYIDDAIRTNRPFDTFTPFRRFRAAPVLAVQEPGVISSEGRVMWRLQEYFTLAAQEEFYVHCRELRDWIADPPPPTAEQEKLLGDAARHQRAGQPERAEALCDQLLATDPAHAPALRLLGGPEKVSGCIVNSRSAAFPLSWPAAPALRRLQSQRLDGPRHPALPAQRGAADDALPHPLQFLRPGRAVHHGRPVLRQRHRRPPQQRPLLLRPALPRP